MSNGRKMKGTLVLMTKNVLNFNHKVTKADAICTSKIEMRLLGAAGKDSKKALWEKHPASPSNSGHGEDSFSVTFELDKNFKTPEAFSIKNSMQSEFFLVSLTLEGNSNDGTIHFVCNSWIYRAQEKRTFFVNKAYLPDKTPKFLVEHRKKELKSLRGDGKGTRKEHDRIYDYDVYNDLGNPDTRADLVRPVLGGSSAYPYPRRGRTGRKATNTDKNSETPSSHTYIPRDENFGHLKSSDFLIYGIKLFSENVTTQFKSDSGLRNEFDKFDDIHELFERGLPHNLPEDVVRNIKEISPIIGERFLKFPTPDVIRVSKSAWMTDDEFGREMLAGVNPCVIQRLQEFPPRSKLDASKYGDQTSTITREHLKKNLGNVEEALNDNKLFILDYHDAFLPYLKKINELPTTKSYATRTIFLFLKDDGTLKPLAIELSLPNPEGDRFGAHSTVILPEKQGVKGTIWQLAKAYVLVNDSSYHQLVTHWLNTHAIIEPFVIATNRNLSVLHPIHKLLSPHYRGTMNVNGIARQSLFNAGGIIEQSFLPGPYALEMSSAAYKNWVFTDQALPKDLVKRGMAIKDPSAPHGLRLVIEDYPYAVDGLEIWSAIERWVKDYVDLYYFKDSDVNNDTELGDWWKEVVKKGHGDLKDKPWWPKLKTLQDLYQICSIIIWTASGLHAAVNFGQYPYGGFILNRPTLSRRLIPEKGKAEGLEYDEMEKNPEKAYLRTFTPKYETLMHLSVIEILSRHASDEVYLGQRDNPNWIDDKKALRAFEKFGEKLKEIEDKIMERNKDSRLRNRVGSVQMPYTLLVPSCEDEGLTFRGIPNSISI